MMHLPRLFVVLGFAGALLVGCSAQPKKATEAGAGAAAEGATTAGAGEGGAFAGEGAATAGAGAAAGFQGDPLNDPNSLLAKRVVYFDFDSSVVRDEFSAIVEAHAGYLAEHPNVRVTLEGHADERGTREYNLGLGERRAQAVQQFLTLMGAQQGQIQTVSYGEERPVAAGHDDESWRLNRRVEIVYQR